MELKYKDTYLKIGFQASKKCLGTNDIIDYISEKCSDELLEDFGTNIGKQWSDLEDLCTEEPYTDPISGMTKPLTDWGEFFEYANDDTTALYERAEELSHDSINVIESNLRQFNEERDWDQFHDGKNLALALSIEASELNEAFLWKKAEDVNPDKVKEELADVFNYAFMMADKYNLDVKEICLDKIKRNAEKYPMEKAKGTAKKYTELQ